MPSNLFSARGAHDNPTYRTNPSRIGKAKPKVTVVKTGKWFGAGLQKETKRK